MDSNFDFQGKSEKQVLADYKVAGWTLIGLGISLIALIISYAL
jgi:hypothetical protein